MAKDDSEYSDFKEVVFGEEDTYPIVIMASLIKLMREKGITEVVLHPSDEDKLTKYTIGFNFDSDTKAWHIKVISLEEAAAIVRSIKNSDTELN